MARSSFAFSHSSRLPINTYDALAFQSIPKRLQDPNTTPLTSQKSNMPVIGLRSVASCIAAGCEGPQHIDEPWDYDFEINQVVWVRLQYSGGHGAPAKWVLGKVISKPFKKVIDGKPCKHYKVAYVQSNGLGVCIDTTCEFGGLKPDSYYIRELLKEELTWPLDSQ